MPVRKKTALRRRQTEIDETIKHALLHGPGSVERGTPGHKLLVGRLFDDTKHRQILEAWQQHHGALLVEWRKTAPGVEPWVVQYLERKCVR